METLIFPVFKGDLNLAQEQTLKAAGRETYIQKYCMCLWRTKPKPRPFILTCIKLSASILMFLCSGDTFTEPCLSSAGELFFYEKTSPGARSASMRTRSHIIWPWSAWPQWFQLPCHRQSCCAGRTEAWWRPGKRRQLKSSCSRLGLLICRGRQRQRLQQVQKRQTEQPAKQKPFNLNTHADRETLVAGITSTLLGCTRTDESHVTTLSPMRNFPGVAPPAPQIHTIWKQRGAEPIVSW